MKKFLKQVRGNILAGILLIIPLLVSALIITRLFVWFDSALPGVIGMEWAPGVGLLVTLIIAYFFGIAAKNYFGKKLIATGNTIISSIPIVNKIYLAVQQIVDAVSIDNKKLFERAVLIEFPKAGCYSIGFVTCEENNTLSQPIGIDLVAVFVPTTPNPTSGFLLYSSVADIVDLNIPVEHAIKLVMSAGMLNADHLKNMATTANIPSSLKGWNWMGIFKRDASRSSLVDPRD